MYKDSDTKRFAYMFDPQKYTSILNKSDVYPTKKIKFEDLEVSIYCDPDKYLTTRYGDYMKLPPEDKRHTHPPYSLIFDKEKERK